MIQSLRKIGIGLLCALLTVITGCWSSKEIEDLSIYVGVGMDIGNETEFEREVHRQGADYPKREDLTVTIQIVPPLNARDDSDGSVTPVSRDYFNERLTGDSVFQIFRQFSLREDHPLVGHHLKLIVISDALAQKYSLEQIFDFIIRDNDIRPSCLIMVSKGSAYEALTSNKTGIIPAFYLTKLSGNQYRSNKILTPTSLIKLDSIMHSGNSFLLQNIISAQGEHKFSGASVFKGDTKKWIGELTQYEVEGLSWIVQNVRGAAVKTYTPDGNTVTFENTRSRYSIVPTVTEDTIAFHVKVRAEGRLIEDWTYPDAYDDPGDSKYISDLEDIFEQEIRKQIEEVLHKTQQEYGVDVAGFGDRLRIKHPKAWKKVQDHWDDAFSKAKITLDIDVNIANSGTARH